MLVRQAKGMLWWRFPGLEEIPGLVHGIFGPDGQNRNGDMGPFNVSLASGQPRHRVLAWRRTLGGLLGFRDLVFIRQVHGDRILEADDGDDFGPERPAGSYDAAMTGTRGRGLIIQVADCQAVLMVDPRRRAVANVHAGWRGTVAGLPARVVAAMARRYGSRPADLLCAVGPSLGPCCAEFVNWRRELPPEFARYRDGRDRFDFWQITADQLADAGVRPERIFQSRICTRCNPARFYSYRGRRTGLRFAAAVGFA